MCNDNLTVHVTMLYQNFSLLIDCQGNPNCEEQVDKFFDDYCNSLSAYTGTLPSTAATIEKLPAESNAECTPSSQVRNTNFPIVRNNTSKISMPLTSLWAQIDTFKT